MEKLSDSIFYEKAVFTIISTEDASIGATVNNRPVRLQISHTSEGILLTVRTDDPVPFTIRIKRPSHDIGEGFGFFLNGRENDRFSVEEEFISVDRVWSGKTVIELRRN